METPESKTKRKRKISFTKPKRVKQTVFIAEPAASSNSLVGTEEYIAPVSHQLSSHCACHVAQDILLRVTPSVSLKDHGLVSNIVLAYFEKALNIITYLYIGVLCIIDKSIYYYVIINNNYTIKR